MGWKTSEDARAYKEAHRDEIREKNRLWAINNPDKVQASRARALTKHKERYATDTEYREKTLTRTKKWQQDNPEYLAAYSRKLRYGLSDEDYRSLLEECDGGCSICGAKTKLHVDHSAANGRVRALLCPNCNKMIGLAKEDINTLRSAAMYLLCFQESEN